MKRNKTFFGLVAIILSVVCICSLWIKGTNNAQAATRLYGVQQVVEKISEEDPFVLLELVPDEAYASMGYYALGEESNIKAELLKNCQSEMERKEKVFSLLGGLLVAKADNGDGTEYPLYYNGIYQEQVSQPADLTGWGILEFEKLSDGSYYTENRVGYYQYVGENLGDYKAVPNETEEEVLPPSEGSSGEVTPPPSEGGSGEVTPPPSEGSLGEVTPPPSEGSSGEVTPSPSEGSSGEVTPPPSEGGSGEVTTSPSEDGIALVNIGYSDRDIIRVEVGASSGDNTSGDNASGDNTSGDNASGDNTSGDNTSGASSGDNTSGDNTSGDNASGDNTSGDNTSGASSGDNTSGDNASGDNTSGDNTSGDNTLGASSGDNTSGDNTSGDNASGDNTSGDNTSGDNTSGDNTSGDSGTDEPVVTYSYHYRPGEGDYKWVDDVNSKEIYTVAFEKLYYKVDVTSNDWFAKYVLEYEKDDDEVSNIKVITLTPSQLELNISKGFLAEEGNVKINGWNEVDLLYISNSTCLNISEDELDLFDTYFENEIVEDKVVYTNDISAQTGYNIYEYVLNTSLPVIVDSSLVSGVTELNTNLQKLAFLLRDYTTETTPEFYKTADGSVIDVSSWVTAWPTGLSNILLKNVDSKAFGTNGSVQGSVYFNSGSNMLNAAFATVFSSVGIDAPATSEAYTTAEGTLKGITAVISEIDSENFYNEVNKVDYTTEYNKNANQIEISKSSVVKYILGYAHRRVTVYKDKITVLDIEPTKYSTLTSDKIRGWLRTEDSARIQQIEIVQTTTSEFIGMLTDLNAEYDMIYIGDCIGPYNEHGSMNQKDGETIYNDSENMNGLIYSHTGDSYQSEYRFGGLLSDEHTAYGKETDKLKTNLFEIRFSGNDITEEKMNELKQFIDSGYPVVVADKFITDNHSVNSEYVDDSSYLYEFMNYSLQKQNLMSDDMSASAIFANYLNMSKLYLSMISWPTEYKVNYDDKGECIESVRYLLEDKDGKYVLEYTFEFTNNSGVRVDNLAYEVELFVDVNADGRYDNTEELDGLSVRETLTKNEVSSANLVTGVRYTVTRELPDGYVGMIPWKLEITQKSKTSTSGNSDSKVVHTSTVGYTAVPAKTLTEINVLQITAKSTVDGQGNKVYSGLVLDNNTIFKELIENVETTMQYDINIDEISVNDYIAKYKEYDPKDESSDAYEDLYEDYLAQYDMLIIGFIDKFEGFESNGATMAIRRFIESGRSVMFSHDATSFVNAPPGVYHDAREDSYWGYYFNKNIRSVVGLDRYGVTEDSRFSTANDLNFANEKNLSYNYIMNNLNKDIAFTPNNERKTSERQVHGFSNTAVIIRTDNTQNVGGMFGGFGGVDVSTIDGQLEDVYYKYNDNATYNPDRLYNHSRVSKISQVNKGQITSFPYDINVDELCGRNVTSFDETYQMLAPKTLAVEQTHSQYYQLDMKFDKTGDGESDIVVWYCLADGIYDAVPNDVRNNYYIYSVGNITYSGLGHTSSNFKSWDEAKLFVNTMIASFNAGKKDPQIAIVQDSENKSVIKQYSYRPYDEEIGLVDTSNEVINFYVTDNNIIHGSKAFTVKYYVETKDANSAATTITEGGNTVYLRELKSTEIASSTSNDAIKSNIVTNVQIDPGLFSSAFADANTGSVKIYISAQTTLTHSTGKVETTGTAFTSITVKALEMFDLD